MANENTQIYHERQRLQFCLLHSLNNLFQNYVYKQQENAFTRASLNEIADKLVVDDTDKETWTPLSILFKPHHNTITGNYDINVLISALEGKGKSVIWHDRRNGASSIDLDGPEDGLMGIVLNVPVRRYGGLWRSRHWVTLRRIDGMWYNLDSDLAVPQAFKDTEEVKKFLDYIIGNGGEILLVMNDNR
ncbi:josephin-like protein isoform X1 [Ziziphus jujuba]|uniref:ubiquitinyl hydrolase 1 n=1 Tax=Ziziphus jujuba TaxID=326968 RepID=A0ABM3IAG5_ZIZJJ|nr:josephin-like protein isoform X1 [Ziziphus jujuba]